MISKEANPIGSKPYYPGITGFASPQERKSRGVTLEAFEKLNQRHKIYSPQPMKFEGYSSFPRPLSRPYINKMHHFDINNIEVPKAAYTQRYLSGKNEEYSTINKSEKFIRNNLGIKHLTASVSLIKKPKVDHEKLRHSVQEKLKEHNVRPRILEQSNVKGEFPYRMQGDGRGKAELRKEIKQGKFKITRDVGKIVALKHILDMNDQGTMVHGRVLTKPNEPKKPVEKPVVPTTRLIPENLNEASRKLFQKYLALSPEEEEIEKNPSKEALFKSLTNKYDCSPTRRRMTIFNLSKGHFVDNYAIKKKYEETHVKQFMPQNYAQFTKMQQLPEMPDEEALNDKKKVDEVAETIEKIKSAKENNILFDKPLDESDISEVKDPLLINRCKSDRFMETTMNKFKIDSE